MEDYILHYHGRTLDQMSAIQTSCWRSAEACARWLAQYVRAGARQLIIRVGSLRPENQLKEIATVVLPWLRVLG
ncbi:hypothetical protein [Streptomyces tagetis]|uniref:hypothetical protein n=1 Tax=Streptomyces tagetis TaxID=2820809 RepID=UPI001FF7D2A0|nr:hypothetical protein [Streptomyces sp. RG38]